MAAGLLPICLMVSSSYTPHHFTVLYYRISFHIPGSDKNMLAAVHFYIHSAQAWVLLSTRKWPNPACVPCLSPRCISAHSVIPIPVLRHFLTDLHLVLNIPAFSQALILTSSSTTPSTIRPFPPLPVFFLLTQTPHSLPPVPKLILDLASFQTTLSCVSSF